MHLWFYSLAMDVSQAELGYIHNPALANRSQWLLQQWLYVELLQNSETCSMFFAKQSCSEQGKWCGKLLVCMAKRSHEPPIIIHLVAEDRTNILDLGRYPGHLETFMLTYIAHILLSAILRLILIELRFPSLL